MTKLAPSMLSADPLRVGDDLASVCANADLVHLDIMDGHFVPNLALGMDVCAGIIKNSTKPCYSHLMVTNPQDYLERLVNFGSAAIVWHVEVDIDHSKYLSLVKAMGKMTGLAISPDTNPSALIPFAKTMDMVTVMSVYPGRSGQSFITSTLDKIKTIKKMGNFLVEVDGGVNLINAKEIVSAGADILVSGASFFKSDDRASFGKAIRSL
ncbi:MAG: ribulose-phosphate 3-epimerase [Caldisericia bacterium]|nr:ribulose-phosphate 3-epimerase [Caldisericia bacterium]